MRLFTLLSILFITTSFSLINSKDNILVALEGKWAWQLNIGTEDYNPQTISFNEDHSKIIFNVDKSIEISKDNFVKQYEYEILKIKKNKLRLSLIGETRKSKDGKKVWWELILINNSTFLWKRNDWETAYSLNPMKKVN